MTVKFLRIIGASATTFKPAVLAIVDGHRVKWNGGDKWSTECDCPEGDECAHVDAVIELLDPRVLGDAG